ncbi:hypothetical protein HY969_02665 [Candidatus Kaiserbacteria bacterium]|nr:hypothetical protein [Candidatus Kaiserbacteria bacterium]
MVLEYNADRREESGIFPGGDQFYTPATRRPLGHEDINLIDKVVVAINENDTFTLSQKVGLQGVILVFGELLHSITEGRLKIVENKNPLQRHLLKLQTLIRSYSKDLPLSEQKKFYVQWGYHQLSFLEEAGFDWKEITDAYRQNSRALASYALELNQAAAMLNKPPLFDDSVGNLH